MARDPPMPKVHYPNPEYFEFMSKSSAQGKIRSLLIAFLYSEIAALNENDDEMSFHVKTLLGSQSFCKLLLLMKFFFRLN